MPFFCTMVVGIFCLQPGRADVQLSVKASVTGMANQSRIEIEGRGWNLVYRGTDMLRFDPRIPGIKRACVQDVCIAFRRSCDQADDKLRCTYDGNSGELDSFSVTADSPEAMQRALHSIAIHRHDDTYRSDFPLALLDEAAGKP